jgi:hypothetical protein
MSKLQKWLIVLAVIFVAFNIVSRGRYEVKSAIVPLLDLKTGLEIFDKSEQLIKIDNMSGNVWIHRCGTDKNGKYFDIWKLMGQEPTEEVKQAK